MKNFINTSHPTRFEHKVNKKSHFLLTGPWCFPFSILFSLMGMVSVGDSLLQSKVPCYIGTTRLYKRIQGKFGVLLQSVPFHASGRSQGFFDRLEYSLVKPKGLEVDSHGKGLCLY